MKKISVAIIFFSLILTSCTPQPKIIGWSLIRPSNSPPPLFHSSSAYNSTQNEGVVFGGITNDDWSNETWLWKNGNWQKASPAVRPPAREKAAMAYDLAQNKIILFGGMFNSAVFDDTWVWDGHNWQVINPAHTPPARCCHAMAFDSNQEKVVLYGGWNNVTGEFFSDTWVWDGNDWAEVTCCNAPPASGHTMLNFFARKEIITLSSSNDGIWIWDGTLWQNPVIDLPPARQDSRLVFYDEYEQAVLFAGIHEGEFLNDTWTFDGKTWTMLSLPTQPAARYGHSMFYDRQRQSVILFGGADEDGVIGDTWEFVLPEN
ncbi:Kelch repeat-containing protein [Candidatus Leptofilum sp.]|uniref:Kelch repeat-containing protein n=1 Tax=Candidatus Leptofilum sp. TaxID=3241576 RepID=UPI003B5CE702